VQTGPNGEAQHEAKPCPLLSARSDSSSPEVILKDAELPFPSWEKDQGGSQKLMLKLSQKVSPPKKNSIFTK